MIPRGRETVTEALMAQEVGQSTRTFQRSPLGKKVRERLTPVNADDKERLRLYDKKQWEALRDGKRIPPRPTGTARKPHPEDLLSDKEAAAVLGVDPGTVRFYAASGYLPAGLDVHGTIRWPRHQITKRAEAPDQRGQDRARAARARRQETAELLRAARRDGRKEPTRAEIAARYGVTPQAGGVILNDARELIKDS